MHLFRFLQSYGIFFSLAYLLNLVSNIYVSAFLRKIFIFLVCRLLEYLFYSQITESRHFHSCVLNAKLSPGSYHNMQNSLSSPPPLHSLEQRKVTLSSSPYCSFLKVSFINLRTFFSFVYTCSTEKIFTQFTRLLDRLLFDVFSTQMIDIITF